MISKEFVSENLLTKTGNLNPRALERYAITKEMAYQAYHGLESTGLCKECSAPTAFLSFKKGYALFCSNVCAGKNKDIQLKKKETVLRKYGPAGLSSAEITARKKKTSMERYGVEHARQSKEYMAQLKDKFFKNYGTTNPTWTDAANQKRKKTNIDRYGCENPMSNQNVKDKVKTTNFERYGVSTALLLNETRSRALNNRKDSDTYMLLDDPKWLEDNKHVPSTLLSEKLGVAWSTILNYYKKHSIKRPAIIVSKIETDLCGFLKEHGIEFETSNRTILDGKEIDIYLPRFKLGIEVNGLYWHSDKFKIDPFYHLNKTKLANNSGIDLIHITDSELINKPNVVYNRLLNKLGLSDKYHARKCKVIKLDYFGYRAFMEDNHIQGAAQAKVRLALEYNGNIVAVMSFSKSRYNKKYQWELIRYASIGTVVGGASKLFKYFVNSYNPESIISYSDIRWNTGKLYETIGMEYHHTSLPNYWYIIDGQMVHRSAFQKHKLKSKLISYDENKTEVQNMNDNNYHRYWDCGNKVFVWNAK